MPGGVLITVSAKAMAELAKRAPVMPADAFQHWVATYNIERTHVQLSPAKARDQLDALANNAGALLLALNGAINDEAVFDYLSWETTAFGDFNLPLRVQDDLRRLVGLAEHARRQAEVDAKAGRALSAETKLIHRLARAIERAGHEPDYRLNGPLVQAFGIAIEETGHCVADLKGTVKSALASYTGGQ